jgi:hypothetical protein
VFFVFQTPHQIEEGKIMKSNVLSAAEKESIQEAQRYTSEPVKQQKDDSLNKNGAKRIQKR